MGWWGGSNVCFSKPTSSVMSKVDVRARRRRGASRARTRSQRALTSTFDITNDVGFKKLTLGYHHHTVIDFREHMKRNISQLLKLAKENVIACEKTVQYDNATTELWDIPSRQPGLCPSTLTNDQRKLLVQKGLFQPKLSNYPKNKSIPAGKQAQFFSKWYLIHPHLEYSIDKDTVFSFVFSLF